MLTGYKQEEAAEAKPPCHSYRYRLEIQSWAQEEDV